jgi:hypothetical protein
MFDAFKNIVTGRGFLRDGIDMREGLAKESDLFWDGIAERNPLDDHPFVNHLTPLQKGEIIVERFDAEQNPKRFVELLATTYELLAYRALTPRDRGDSLWNVFLDRLSNAKFRSDFDQLEIIEKEKPKKTQEVFGGVPENILLPGIIEINFLGKDSVQLPPTVFKSKTIQAFELSRLRKEEDKKERKKMRIIFLEFINNVSTVIARFLGNK